MLFLYNLFSGCEFQNSFSYFKKLFKLSHLPLKSTLLRNITTDKFSMTMCDWKMSWSVGERKLPLADFKWLNFLRRFANFFIFCERKVCWLFCLLFGLMTSQKCFLANDSINFEFLFSALATIYVSFAFPYVLKLKL